MVRSCGGTVVYRFVRLRCVIMAVNKIDIFPDHVFEAVTKQDVAHYNVDLLQGQMDIQK